MSHSRTSIVFLLLYISLGLLCHCLGVSMTRPGSTSSSSPVPQTISLKPSPMAVEECEQEEKFEWHLSIVTSQSSWSSTHCVIVSASSSSILVTQEPCSLHSVPFHHRVVILLRPSENQLSTAHLAHISTDVRSPQPPVYSIQEVEHFPSQWTVSSYLQDSINATLECLPQQSAQDENYFRFVSFQSRRLLQMNTTNSSSTPSPPSEQGTSTSTIIIAVVVPVGSVLLIILVGVCVCIWLKKRQGAGVYNPEKQEQQRGQTDMNLNKVLSIPPRERLI